MIEVDAASFFAVVVVAAIAAVLVVVIPRPYAPPVVVLELILGILVGPQVLGIASSDDFIEFFSNLGLGMLFFFAGYEIDFDRIRGKPLKLGGWGWAASLALAYGIGGVLAAAGIVKSLLYTGSAMATTAIGTLIPILRDSGELRTRFGTYLLAAGAVGEFGPILLITLVLSTTQPIEEALILAAFIALAIALALVSMRLVWRGFGALERTVEASNQLAIRRHPEVLTARRESDGKKTSGCVETAPGESALEMAAKALEEMPMWRPATSRSWTSSKRSASRRSRQGEEAPVIKLVNSSSCRPSRRAPATSTSSRTRRSSASATASTACCTT